MTRTCNRKFAQVEASARLQTNRKQLSRIQDMYESALAPLREQDTLYYRLTQMSTAQKMSDAEIKHSSCPSDDRNDHLISSASTKHAKRVYFSQTTMCTLCQKYDSPIAPSTTVGAGSLDSLPFSIYDRRAHAPSDMAHPQTIILQSQA